MLLVHYNLNRCLSAVRLLSIVIFDGMEKKGLSDWNMISPIKWKYDENFNLECVHLNIFVSESNWFEVSEDKILVYIDETMKDTGILPFYIKFTKVILNSASVHFEFPLI